MGNIQRNVFIAWIFVAVFLLGFWLGGFDSKGGRAREKEERPSPREERGP